MGKFETGNLFVLTVTLLPWGKIPQSTISFWFGITC